MLLPFRSHPDYAARSCPLNANLLRKGSMSGKARVKAIWPPKRDARPLLPAIRSPSRYCNRPHEAIRLTVLLAIHYSQSLRHVEDLFPEREIDI